MTGFIYAIEADNGLIKIGFTTELRGRLSHLRANNCLKLHPLGFANGTQDQEAELHGLLGSEHVRGEWFFRGKLVNHFLSMLASWPWQRGERTQVVTSAFNRGIEPFEIKALRERLEWSQQQLADYLGLTQASVSRLEASHQELSRPVLKLLTTLAEEKRSAAA